MIELESTYADLPDAFYQHVAPSSAVQPELLAFNASLADELGLSLAGRSEHELAELFSGQRVPPNARPIAMAYAGHQFGGFVPQLGDGRAILLGEVVTPAGERFDIHLKGAGQTAYSRNGDGRSSLGPVIREYIVSEAMNALGIPTTRALAAVATGETVYREGPLPGAMMARVAASHIRVGTFEYFAARGQIEHLQALADYVIARHYPAVADADEPVVELLRQVATRQVELVARWMGIGFIHGVMNTDNTSISGQTIDYGPCAFMDAFNVDQVYSSIDRYGRYRYRNQGQIVMWNLAVLANCLIPLVAGEEKLAADKLNDVLNGLGPRFDLALLEVMGAKLGIFAPREEDSALIDAWLLHLHSDGLDFTNSFRDLARGLETDAIDPALGEPWQARLADQSQSIDEAVALMDAHNPVFIPRNHQVEAAIQGALDGDLEHVHRLNRVLAEPYRVQPEHEALRAPPRPHEVVHQTFCGT